MKEYDGKVNKEFIPLIFVIATPVIAYMNGFGVRTARFPVDIYFMAPFIFGIFMNFRHGIRKNYLPAALLLLLNLFVASPLLYGREAFDGNFTCLYTQYAVILIYYIVFSASFILNDPYYAGYYSSNNSSYRKLYFVAGLFFAGVAVYHLILFIRVISILKLFHIN